ncbi:hypothetical protein SO802_010637 [Lithocarpus litseifolius]|uniref:non-specific serine/threonine protein kinase n=1 Tax=Lithocarpus litseifolius TaxID=425828 RepID=A0AAW2DER7_9ROSI
MAWWECRDKVAIFIKRDAESDEERGLSIWTGVERLSLWDYSIDDVLINSSPSCMEHFCENVKQLPNLRTMICKVPLLTTFPAGVLWELENLPHLFEICIAISHHADIFEDLMSLNKLPGCIRKLSLFSCNVLISTFSCNELTSLVVSPTLISRMEHLELRQCSFLREVKIDHSMDYPRKKYLDKLCKVVIGDCGNLRDVTWLTGTPKLETLDLRDCDYLRDIIGDQLGDKANTEKCDLSYNNLEGSFPSWVSQQNLQLYVYYLRFCSLSVLPSGLNCLQRGFPCNRGTGRYSDLAIKCGGPQITSSNGIVYEWDNETLGPATYYVIDTDRYYGLGLENGNYIVSLQFAETAFLDSITWKSLGRRVFNIYIQGKLFEKDFDIRKEAGGVSFVAVSKNRTGLIVGLVGVGVLSFLSVFMFLYVMRRRKPPINDDEELLGIDAKTFTFSYAELNTATEDFSPDNKLGEGGFGPVYKGTLNDGRVTAVKQLSDTSHQGKNQFITEIATMLAVQHRNLVKLYGCCIEGDKRLLVDVKASNILLDANLIPKISDFGLAKLYDDKKTHMSTGVAGPIGYLASEYAMHGHLTEKADVFAFGVVALEHVSGRPNSDSSLEEEKIYLLEWLHENNREVDLADSKLSEFNEEEVKRLIGVSLLCTQAFPTLQPSISCAMAMVLGDIEVSTITSRPGYLTDWKYDDITNVTSEGATDTSYFNSSSASASIVGDGGNSPANASKPVLGDTIK